MTSGPRFDVPTPEHDTVPYWDAAREGRLLIRRCRECGEAGFYPRPFCPSCWSADVEWEEASGRATLYTFSVIHQNELPPFAGWLPYVAAIVELEEGPRMMTNVVDCDLDALAVGMALEVTFREHSDTITAPVFRPAR